MSVRSPGRPVTPPSARWQRCVVVAIAIAVLPGTGAAAQAKQALTDSRDWRVHDRRHAVAVRADVAEGLPIIAAAARRHGVVDSAVAMARRHLRLPKLLFVARSCGSSNAYYFPRDGHVVVCYEMLLDAYRLLSRHEAASLADTQASDRQLADAIRYAQFLFAHELGHAVIHRYRVPVVGEEEAAADQFALWLLSEDRAGPGLAVAHYVFVLLSLNEEWTDERVVDPHGLDLRRAQRIACWLSSIEELRSATALTAAERRRCAVAVSQAHRAWARLLAPYRLRRPVASRPYVVGDGRERAP